MADYEYIVDTGVIVPDTSDLLAAAQNEFKTAFGADLIVTPDTPQGVLATARADARDSVVRNNAALANQINPNLAGGTALDAICALTALERTAATKSTVIATLTGVAGTMIPAGSTAKTTAGNVFSSAASVVLDGSGTATVQFIANEYGPIPVGVAALNKIVSAVLGWENITNAAVATLGQLIQSDQSLRGLRKVTLAGQGVGISEAIISELYKVPGVQSLKYRENPTGVSVVFDTVTLVKNSVYACVNGGTNLDIATALLEKKSSGSDWNGAVSVVVTEPSSGQPYTIKFDRPTAIPLKVRATVSTNSTLVNPSVVVPLAILDYVNGLQEGELGFVVGNNVSPFELSGAVNREYPGIYVQNMELSTDGGTTWITTPVTIHINQIATLIAANILVVVV